MAFIKTDFHGTYEHLADFRLKFNFRPL